MSDCPNCAAKDAVIEQLILALRTPPQVLTLYQPAVPGTASAPSFYDQCPCNPKNGGSGVCGCIRGSQTICGGH